MNYLVLGLFVSISTLTAILPANVQAKGNPLEGSISIDTEELQTINPSLVSTLVEVY